MSLFLDTTNQMALRYVDSVNAIDRLRPDLDRCDRIAADIAAHNLQCRAFYHATSGLEIYIKHTDNEHVRAAVIAAAQAANMEPVYEPNLGRYLLVGTADQIPAPKNITIWSVE
ncbi:hypothetical protein PWG14_25330 [Chromobacterium amazonense]|uniref:hypothetical protein n=1 Tax=Chromobacterium amazonense TaxID=1382803 RepID=UPI00237E8B0E|nr:hypothetical protein [Chromobacterium amazonense]MDE1715794.1 hypothetical protein [Chromobacterium amazonense]